MSTIHRAIEVAVPIRTAYDQWTQFEGFPTFMEGVERVEQLDDRRLRWTAEILGQKRTWDAEITRQEPDTCIAWQSTSGAKNDGIVTFESLSPDRTRIALRLDVEPDGPIENLGDKIGAIDRRVKGDLERFRDFIEGTRVPTGAWRGTIGASR